MKISVRYILFIWVALFSFFACKEKKKPIQGKEYSGVFFGQPYTISVIGDTNDYRPQIDSVLYTAEYAFNLADTNSLISRFNRFKRTDSSFVFQDSSLFFGLVYSLATDLNAKTKQFYDPSTTPIKREWMIVSFTKKSLEPNLDSLYQFVGFDASKIDLNEVYTDDHRYVQSNLRKSDPRTELDFSSVAMAYGLQCVADFFATKGIAHYNIHCGNHTINHGALVDSLTTVPLGISQDANDQRIRLLDGAFTFKTVVEKRGMIDPTYGYPVDNELVYVGVYAKSLAEAEAFSEAFMIMGFDQASKWYEENQDSNIHSFMLIQRGDSITSASTVGFDELLLQADSLKIEE
jgi:thiamine biosynthesis lipoprotein ApbE